MVRIAKIRCGNSPECGGDSMGVIYILWLREIKRTSVPAYRLYIAGSACALFAGARVRVWPGVREGRRRKLPPIHGPGRDWNDCAIQFRLFGHRHAVRSPVRLPERNVRRAGLATTDHGGRTLGGATVAIIQGCLILIICLIAGFLPAHWIAIPVAFLFVIMIAIVFAAMGTALGSVIQDMQGFPTRH